jgi:hypothetical protein
MALPSPTAIVSQGQKPAPGTYKNESYIRKLLLQQNGQRKATPVLLIGIPDIKLLVKLLHHTYQTPARMTGSISRTK